MEGRKWKDPEIGYPEIFVLHLGGIIGITENVPATTDALHKHLLLSAQHIALDPARATVRTQGSSNRSFPLLAAIDPQLFISYQIESRSPSDGTSGP